MATGKILRDTAPNDHLFVQDQPTQEELDSIYQYLLDHRDDSEAGVYAALDVTVSSVWQEEIASEKGLPLHRVIRAIALLHKSNRLRIDQQPVGKPFRYTLLTSYPTDAPVRIAV